MKKTIVLCLIALTTLSAYGQKKAKAKTKNIAEFTKDFDPATLKTKSDSLTYALGQNMTEGLKQYLEQTDILQDSTAVDFDAKVNQSNMKMFTEGLVAALSTADSEKNTYNAGIAIGNQLKNVSKQFEEQMLDGESVNNDIFIHSLVSALQGKSSVMGDVNEYMQQAAMEMQQAGEIKNAEELKALHGENISNGVKFLAENKQAEGVVTMPSGLQYKILEEGSGELPTEMDRVTVHYEGFLLDGTPFDSSYERGEPATFGVTQVIKGWTEALQMMPVGSKWTIYVPYSLAYGDRDTGAIPPFSTLLFNIELIDIAE